MNRTPDGSAAIIPARTVDSSGGWRLHSPQRTELPNSVEQIRMEVTEMKILFAVRNTICGQKSLKKSAWYFWY
ncbi:hypothetical protein E6W39_37225 [Kitasatospora acidiphila]|uniref:Uncharacterized protein n=1 Tax=Kitasatospora acidiphila TaxID=2567942 RepID=A0A540WEH2_9ACTN|nr:hypothetical protein E6W39_37225 [Kitasatospora acidiphila]